MELPFFTCSFHIAKLSVTWPFLEVIQFCLHSLSSQVFSARILCVHYIIIYLISKCFTAWPRGSVTSQISQESNFSQEITLLGLVAVLHIISGLPEHPFVFSDTEA